MNKKNDKANVPVGKSKKVLKRKKGRQPKKHPFINKTMIFLNIIVIIMLLLSYLASYVSPSIAWYLAFFGLIYPILLCANSGFIVYWLITSKKFVFVPVIAIAIGFNHLANIIQVDFSKEKYPVAKEVANDRKTAIGVIKIMSYNVRLFDLYNWSKNEESRGKIFNLLKLASSDISCFQEFFTRDKGEFQNLDTLLKLQKSYDGHIAYTKTLRNNDHWGIATFSRYPIINKGILKFPKGTSNICIYSDIKINEDTIRVYNAHLQSVHFHNEDYKYIESLNDKTKEKEDFKGAFKIIHRLKEAYIKRSKQADIFAEHIKHSPYPVIVCGDFNDTPSSYTYHTISDNLKDAFVESGNGLGSTFYGLFPSFRIDYIFHDKRFSSDDFQIIHEKLSDHYPITCWIDLTRLK